MTGETRKTEFAASTGERLAAALELPAGEPLAYALFAHCFTCSKDIRAAREIARALRARGFAVLRFDFTGLGGSEGDFANTNFSSNVEDLVAAADYLRNEFKAPSILIGHSLGGAAAIVAARSIPEVKGVATIGAPARADHVAMHVKDKREEIERNGQARVDLAGRSFTITRQFLDDLEGQTVLESAGDLKKPLLVMHAPFDQTVGVDNASEIFLAAKHPKSFVSLDTADHLLSDEGDADYAAGVLAAWSARYIDTGAQTLSSVRPEPASPQGPALAIEPFSDGARAQTRQGEPLAVELSIDGRPMIIDASKAEGGSDLGPNPTRTLEGALAACSAMTVTMYARRKDWPLDFVQVDVRRAPSENDHAPHILVKTLRLDGDLNEDQRARMIEIANRCPVHRLLSEGVEIRSEPD